jgi:hypothetical protein
VPGKHPDPRRPNELRGRPSSQDRQTGFTGSSAAGARVEKTAIEGGQVIGLGPHEMDVWFWVFEIGLTAVLALLAALSIVAALRVTRERPRASVRGGGA